MSVGGDASPPRLPEVFMVPVVAQIELVAPVRAPAVSAGHLRPVTSSAQLDASAQAARNAEQAAINAAQAAKAVRQAPVANDQEIHLTVRSDTHEVIATLVDIETNEVIRQIPAEETRRAAEVIRAITGQLVDKVV